MTTDDSSSKDTARSWADRLAGVDRQPDVLSRALKTMQGAGGSLIPSVEILRTPTPKEQNSFQSAGVLVRRMAQTVAQWRKQVPSDSQPVVLALLQGGVQVNVSLLAEESFHALRIEGTIEGSPCMLLTHQASVQLLCVIMKVEEEAQRRQIGFIIDGQESKA
jgi:hypothetical protein